MIRAIGAALVVIGAMTATVAAQDSKADRLLADANSAYRLLHANEAVKLYRQYLALYPDRADVRVFLGGALLNLNEFQAASEEAQRAIALDDRYGKGYLLAGRIFAAREQWERAQGFFEIAERLDRRDVDAWYFSGRAFYDANRFEQAIQAFEQALRAGWEQSRVYENLGLAQDGLGQFAAAEQSFRKAVELAGGAWRPYLVSGAFLFRQGRPGESLRMLRQALTLAPSAVAVRFELARVLYHEGGLEEAAQVLEPAQSSNECRVHNLLARIYAGSGKPASAAGEIKALENCKAAPDEL